MANTSCTQIADTGPGTVRSKDYSLADGWGSIDMQQFLGHASVSSGGVNRVTDLKMRLQVTFTVAGGKLIRSQTLVSGLIRELLLRDMYGELAQIDGRTWLMLQYIERRGYRLPADTYGPGTYTVAIFLRYPVDNLQGMEGGSGWNWLDKEALEAGGITVTPAIVVGGAIGDAGGANTATVSAASMRWYASVYEEGKDSRFVDGRTLKQRVRYKYFPANSTSMSNPLSVNATLRWQYLDVGAVQADTTVPVTWPTTGVTMTSSTWGLIDPIEFDSLNEEYLAHVEPVDLSLLAISPMLDGTIQWVGVARKWTDLSEIPLDNYANWLIQGMTFGVAPLVGGANSIVSWIEPVPSSATGGCSEQITIPERGAPGVISSTLAPAIQAIWGGKTETVVPANNVAVRASAAAAGAAASAPSGPGGAGFISIGGLLSSMPTGS